MPFLTSVFTLNSWPPHLFTSSWYLNSPHSGPCSFTLILPLSCDFSLSSCLPTSFISRPSGLPGGLEDSLSLFLHLFPSFPSPYASSSCPTSLQTNKQEKKTKETIKTKNRSSSFLGFQFAKQEDHSVFLLLLLIGRYSAYLCWMDWRILLSRCPHWARTAKWGNATGCGKTLGEN